MNPINAAAASSLLPLPPSRLAVAPACPPCPPAACPTVAPVAPPGVAGPVTWSPGLWWLLHRYEYLFVGLLPTTGQESVETVETDPAGPREHLGQPHWDEPGVLNPPPAAATTSPTAPEPPAMPGAVSQLFAGKFVDLLA